MRKCGRDAVPAALPHYIKIWRVKMGKIYEIIAMN